MPIYEYECEKCGPFEVMQRITEAPLKRCETCGKPVKKLMSNTSFALKGGGWYKDLYSSSKSSSSTSDSSSSSSSTSSSSSSSSTPSKKDTAAA